MERWLTVCVQSRNLARCPQQLKMPGERYYPRSVQAVTIVADDPTRTFPAQAHFCYRCGKSLKPSDPYEHYRLPSSGCFEKLFDEAEIARFEREMAGREAENVDWGMIAGGGGGIWG